ncbi:MAG: cytochrome c biogenesis protein CcdA [Acidobacteria bacterium]|nr:cytochrome c biogenesis protein CcdA [Acidobacteriota bacterium]
MSEVSYLAAFVGGFLSFISPCVLPLIPGYLSFVSGLSMEEFRGGTASSSSRWQLLSSSLAFVAGFSLVFIALGASASVVGEFLMSRLPLLGKIAGVLIIVFGLHTMGVFRLPFLDAEKRVHAQRKPAGLLGAMVVGIAFAFGWTPCIGPILGGILVMAGRQETIGDGVKLLSVYSAGLGIPFLLTALAMNRFFHASARIRRHYHAVEVASGVLLIAIGVLIFTNQFTIIARYLEPYLPTY